MFSSLIFVIVIVVTTSCFLLLFLLLSAMLLKMTAGYFSLSIVIVLISLLTQRILYKAGLAKIKGNMNNNFPVILIVFFVKLF